MLKGRGIIVFFAVVALFHIINAGAIPERPSENPALDLATGFADTVRKTVESGIETGIHKTKEVFESVQTGIETVKTSVESIMKSPSNTGAPPLPTAAPLKADTEAPPPIVSHAPVEEESA